ncbi:Imm74 family immunity protein [Massilia sp. Mn16-1_5]|uniref:Imm74 family immunity protein n=1 Tax=Massilia sp. Mn16-1_5 TaxID=2079199 RepID=UPI00109E684C|nr:Imm74 family immunity protein [Massilia sp. Mn16-1_5]THC40345.1 hypothetical protein C2862_21740 [Massilia sp. Mn16-1_5]
MILNITRGHIWVKLGERTASIPGEMLFPKDGKMGFVVYRDQIDYWEPKEAKESISSSDITAIIDDIQANFRQNGHELQIEPD